MNKIRQTSPDKVNGKLVKYRLGDCLSIKCSNGKYLAAIMSGKFNAYYNLTFIEYYNDEKSTSTDFLNGKFFGTRFGSWEDLTYAVDQRMIKCKYIDSNIDIEIVGNLKLDSKFNSAGYAYLDDTEEILNYYLRELPIRIQKSINAEKFPAIAFVSKHLIEVKNIIE
jgi:hypothetical protein